MRIFKKLYIVVWIALCLLLCGCRRQEELLLLQASESDEVFIADESGEPEPGIAVYVCGQVVCPGVVYLDAGARAVDAVEAAGGFAEEADTEYVNLAAHVSDGEKLYIPDLQEGLMLREREEELLAGLVNINTADKELLMTLPGIGESKALDIIAYREKQGVFERAEDLMKVSGIKESLFLKVKERIVVE